MKLLSTQAFALLLSLVPSLSALAAEEPIVSIQSADPVCDPAHSTTFHTVMEFNYGIAAWYPVGNWDICVNDGGTSQITVSYKGESLQSQITINGHHVDLASPAENGWALVFTRQDLLNGSPYGIARETSFVLDSHHRERFVLKGRYGLQERDLRFTLSY